MSEPTPAFIKGLFSQLVRVVGGVEAAGAFLGLSHQRVSQLQSTNCADMPSILHVVCLQAAAQTTMMTDAIGDLVTGARAARDLQKETREVLHAAANLDALAAGNAPPKAIDDALARAQRELADVAQLRAANE